MLWSASFGKLYARKRACTVWEGGNGKGPRGTSPVPYFIREGAGGNVITTRWDVDNTRWRLLRKTVSFFAQDQR